MILINELQAQSNRIRKLRELQNWDAIDQAAVPAILPAQQLRGALLKLQELADLDADFAGDAPHDLAEIGGQVKNILEQWRSLREEPTVQKVGELQNKITEAQFAVAGATNQVDKQMRAMIGDFQKQLQDSEFLAVELGVETKSARALRKAVLDYLSALNSWLMSGVDQPQGNWRQLRDKYEKEASPHACLRRAKLTGQLAELVEQLVAKRELPLDQVPGGALAKLATLPALARWCRLSLIAEDRN